MLNAECRRVQYLAFWHSAVTRCCSKNRRELRKPNSVPPSTALRRAAADNDHSSSPVITDGIEQPTRKHRTGRPERFPIWPCSVRGFACHSCCHGRGALLPHLFTLTSAYPAHLKRSGGCCSSRHHSFGRAGHAEAVYFLCHCPSGCPDRALPGALPCGVRTFLPPPCGGRRSSGSLGGTSIIARRPETLGYSDVRQPLADARPHAEVAEDAEVSQAAFDLRLRSDYC
jgi:hypothetical protein